MDTEFLAPDSSTPLKPDPLAERFPWYGVRTRSNHEKVASTVLRGKGYDPYMPLSTSLQTKWAGCTRRGQNIRLFPGYVFCRFDVKKRLPILMTTGVISVLGFGKEPAAIPDEEIEAVKAVLRSGLPAEPCAYLREGQRIRVTERFVGRRRGNPRQEEKPISNGGLSDYAATLDLRGN
jgi:transcription antitermination factor NusG